MNPLDDERLVLGALVRGTLRPADVRGWQPAGGTGLTGRAFGQLHRELLWAVLGCIELTGTAARAGHVDLRRVLRYVGPAAGIEHEGRLLGYLPSLRRPSRGEALRALGRLVYGGHVEQEAREAGEGVVRAIGRGLAAEPEEVRGRFVAGVAAELAAPITTTAPRRRRGRAA